MAHREARAAARRIAVGLAPSPPEGARRDVLRVEVAVRHRAGEARIRAAAVVGERDHGSRWPLVSAAISAATTG